MKDGQSGWLVGINLLIAVSVIGFLLFWEETSLVERLQPAQIDAISWGVRTAVVLTVTIGLTGLIRPIWFICRKGGRASTPGLAVHLLAPILVVLFLVYQHAGPPGPITYAPPEGSAYSYEDVRVPLPNGDVLAGSLTFPRGAGIPAVVLITGSSPHDRDNASPQAPMTAYRPFRQIADRLSSHAIAVLRMDDRGVGQSIGGDIRQLTTAERATDIEAGIAWLRQRPDIDASRIGLVGLSEGVSISHMIASHDERIRALVLLSGIGSPGREVLRYQIQQGVLSENDLSTLLKEDKNTRFLYAFDPLATARLIRQPVLIIHGDKDRFVPYTDAFHLKQAMTENGNNDVTVRLLPGYNHALLEESPDGRVVSARIPDEVLTIILDWLMKRI